MGLLGLRKFIDSTGCTRLLPVPLSEEEALAQAEQQRKLLQQQRPRQQAKPGYGGGHVYQSTDDDDGSEEEGEGEEEGLDASSVRVLTTSSSSAAASPHAESSGLGDAPRVPLVDHVLVDMNCIVHSCFGKHDVATKTKKELIQMVMERLQVLLTQVVIPRKSLTICLDGPAPYAKLQTQRLRRRKVALMDSSAQDLTSLSITAGSLFLVELENAIAAQFKLNQGKGFLKRLCPVYLYGSTVMGEGESKISRALAFLASNAPPAAASSEATSNGLGPSSSSSVPSSAGAAMAATKNGGPHRGQRNTPQGRDRHPSHKHTNGRHVKEAFNGTPKDGGGDGFRNVAPYYNPNDTVTVLGNDIDLVMTCLGATPYHNVSIVGPSALQLISVNDILYRWLRATTTASGGAGGESFRITPEQLPSMRVDFIFLFLLNGGDHYVGAGEVAMPLWRRYRTVRAAYPRSTLVSRQLDILDTDFLVDVLDAKGYTGDADPKPGLSLLQSALWSLYTTVTGICPDYAYVPEPSTPFLQNLRAAAAFLRRKGRQLKLHFDVNSKPLAPLEAYVALMPTEATLPASVATALRQSSKQLQQHLKQAPQTSAGAEAPSRTPQEVARVLLTSNDAGEIALAAKEAIAIAQPFLTPSERYLCQFTPPVQLNAIPPRQRLSRYEQHRMLATKGAITVEDPIPMVRRLDVTLCGTGFETPLSQRQHLNPYSRSSHQQPHGAAEAAAPVYFEPPIAYVNWRYPPNMGSLAFRSPFGAAESDSNDTAASSTPSGVRPSGPHAFKGAAAASSSLASATSTTAQTSSGQGKRVLLARAQRLLTGSEATKATRAAETKLERALAEAAVLRKHKQDGSLKSAKRLHAMQRRVERLRKELDECRRREADEDAALYAVSASSGSTNGKRPREADVMEDDHASDEGDAEGEAEDETFLADIEQFLGDAGDRATVTQLLHAGGDRSGHSPLSARPRKEGKHAGHESHRQNAKPTGQHKTEHRTSKKQHQQQPQQQKQPKKAKDKKKAKLARKAEKQAHGGLRASASAAVAKAHQNLKKEKKKNKNKK